MEREIERAFERLNMRLDLMDRSISKVEQRITAEETIRQHSIAQINGGGKSG